MTNEELMDALASGDESVLGELCEKNMDLIRKRAIVIAQRYDYVSHDSLGRRTDFTKETLSELESVGILAFIECVRGGRYDREKGVLTTYVVPFIDGAMRRYLEANIEPYTICSFFDEDLQDEEDPDPIAGIKANTRTEALVYWRIRIECLEEMFNDLPKKERDILGKCYGVFGYPKTPLREIAMYHMMKEDAVEKARKRILKKLRDAYPTSRMKRWAEINHMVDIVTGRTNDRKKYISQEDPG